MNGAQRIQSGGAGPAGERPAGVDSLVRGLLTLVSATVLLESMFFGVLAPLLPYYEDEFGLSTSALGVLRLSTRLEGSSVRSRAACSPSEPGQDDRPHRPRDHRGHERRVRSRRERLGPVSRPLRPGCRELLRPDRRPRVADRRGAEGTSRRADRHHHGRGDRRGASGPGAGRARVGRRPSDSLCGRSRRRHRARSPAWATPAARPARTRNR